MKHLFILLSAGIVFTACDNVTEQNSASGRADSLQIDRALINALDTSLAPFYHGVASGDPTTTSVVIWTRITPENRYRELSVSWSVATDSNMLKVIKKGDFKTGEKLDYTVKEVVKDLPEGQHFYYQFEWDGKKSIVGRTLTLPQDPSVLTLAFVSCSNFEWGYFNAYGDIARNSEIDVVVHLGDYIYEYAPGTYGSEVLKRKHIPDGELFTLQDYRTRYSQYRLDKDLMMAHSRHPFITTWDDHEIANNAYMDGAQNHQENEGDWGERKAAAVKAYYEWLPVGKLPEEKLFRSFRAGKLANLIVLDTRLEGRTLQVDSMTDPHYEGEDRNIISKEQFDWLNRQLEDSTNWKIIANQVPFGPMYIGYTKKKVKYMDGWDGYPAERARLAENIRKNKLKNIVFVTGDFHRAFAFETVEEDQADKKPLAVEFIVPSISSSNDDEHYSEDTIAVIRKNYFSYNPHLKYMNSTDHGYFLMKITDGEITGRFIFTGTVIEPTREQKTGRAFLVKSGSSELDQLK